MQDAHRFIMYHKQGIENAPLQAYGSALLFSPTGSSIRKLFQDEEPKHIKIKPAMADSWSACLQTLEGHSSSVRLVAFSHDSTRLASASDDKTVKIWDVSSGACLQTLEGHSHWVNSVTFSHDSTQLASASDDNIVKIWNVSSGACLQALDMGRTLYDISFDSTSSYLHTNIGTIALSALETPNTTSTVATPQPPRYQYTTLSSDNTWIRFNSKNLLWLPQEYRPSSSAVSGNTIGIGVASGKVWLYTVNFLKPLRPQVLSKVETVCSLYRAYSLRAVAKVAEDRRQYMILNLKDDLFRIFHAL